MAILFDRMDRYLEGAHWRSEVTKEGSKIVLTSAPEDRAGKPVGYYGVMIVPKLHPLSAKVQVIKLGKIDRRDRYHVMGQIFDSEGRIVFEDGRCDADRGTLSRFIVNDIYARLVGVRDAWLEPGSR